MMDYQNPKAMQAVLMSVLEFVFAQGEIGDHRQLLMGLFPSITTLEDPPEQFCQFFASKDHLDTPSITFCTKLEAPLYEHQFIPQQGSDEVGVKFLSNKLQRQ